MVSGRGTMNDMEDIMTMRTVLSDKQLDKIIAIECSQGNSVTVSVMVTGNKLARELWTFTFFDASICVVLDKWSNQVRATSRHGWKEVGRWSRYDSRRQYSDQPPPVPAKVAEMMLAHFRSMVVMKAGYGWSGEVEK